ncbi:hypothetical protein Psch_03436 [Pelotomaculum schinkii]|uniref:Uncharacterized protein n=1 Tax=Pelotomaculum schinkii TaxID=78350 RepID=A0A4Y7R6V4_9FIRM|nr:hypothetical protein [Pelotomaculum schinkii]TEB04674.1 hypothetical protein Psch_03436 [Pelotomaculum schinkii]
MQINLSTLNEVRGQLEKAYIIPGDTPVKVYTERLDREASNIYRTLKTYEKHYKYPLEIIVLGNRPTGWRCVYSAIDGEILDVYGTGIEKQYVYICPYNLICPFSGGRVTDARVAEDIHSCYKSKSCRDKKGDIRQI